MKGHVAPENLNGGLNNQTSASIVFDRLPPPTSPPLGGHGMLQYSSPCRDGASGSAMTAVTLLQGAPLHLVTGPTRLRPPPPPPPPPFLPSSSPLCIPPSPTTGLAGCRNVLSHPQRESVASVHSPMVCVCVCVWHAFIEQLSQCVCVCVLQQGSAWQPESVACPCVRMWKCVTGLVCESAVECCPAAPLGCQLRFTMLN